MDLSLIIPVYDEVENLERLIAEIHAALDGRELQYELVFIDDGSRDGSFELLRRLQADDSRLVILRFRRNSGQTAAFAAGFDHAQGRILVTLDADGQNDPADIPALLDKLAEGYDVVNGWRQKRQDRLISRRLPSYLANRLIAFVTQVELHDRGCSLRAFRAEAAQELRLYGEMHRFIPELLAAAGFEMAEVLVNHRSRTAGRSKYGLARTLRVLLDLLTVFFIRRYGDRPMHLLGTAGLVFGGLGGLIAALLSSGKIWAGISGGLDAFHAYRLADRPLLLLSVLLVILGSQFLVMGLLAELGVRTYYESQNKPVYHLKDVLRHRKEA